MSKIFPNRLFISSRFLAMSLLSFLVLVIWIFLFIFFSWARGFSILLTIWESSLWVSLVFLNYFFCFQLKWEKPIMYDLDILKFIEICLWFRIWLTLTHGLCVFEKNVYPSLDGWSIHYRSFRTSFLECWFLILALI